MASFIPGPIRGILSLSLLAINTVFWSLLILFLSLLKIAIPFEPWRRMAGRLLNAMAARWIAINTLNQRIFSSTRWDVGGIESLNREGWYMVVANHQSWVDILVLQRLFHRKIPFLKFFLKKELIWFPVLGQAWWALDFPFMRRYTPGFLKRNPHLKGKDLEITRKACEKFKTIPVSVMNFVEGTRFSKEKHGRQKSPYTHLLRPKAGGLAYTLLAMGRQMDRILDVTIAYPDGGKSFWRFLCGEVKEIKVRVRAFEITPELQGDYFNDREYRTRFQGWLNALWTEKDRCIEELLAEGRPAIAACAATEGRSVTVPDPVQ
jgi:1-acyl-sn-glycerol-3-phosphate acyltransferase